MHHVLAYTFPDFSIDSDITKQMEGDFLILSRTAQELGRHGDTVRFYIVAMNLGVQLKLQELAERYGYRGTLDLQFVQPDQRDIQAKLHLLNQSPKDMGGIFVASKLADSERLRFARAVGKRCALRRIKQRESDVEPVAEKLLWPVGVAWDYYGIAN